MHQLQFRPCSFPLVGDPDQMHTTNFPSVGDPTKFAQKGRSESWISLSPMNSNWRVFSETVTSDTFVGWPFCKGGFKIDGLNWTGVILLEEKKYGQVWQRAIDQHFSPGSQMDSSHRLCLCLLFFASILLTLFLMQSNWISFMENNLKRPYDEMRHVPSRPGSSLLKTDIYRSKKRLVIFLAKLWLLNIYLYTSD